MRFQPGELRLAIMGDLLRHPTATVRECADRLETDPNNIRITIGRLHSQGFVRRTQGGYMLTRAGIDKLTAVRRMVSA